MIDKDLILKEFPEARESDSSGHLEYYVHCRRAHKKGGIYKMSINSETGVYYCHDCGATGNVENDYLDVTSQFQSFAIARDDVAHAKRERRNLKEWQDGIPTPGDLMKLSDLDDEHPAIIYMMKKRDINKDMMASHGLMYCSSGQFKFSGGLGTTSGRIIFPIYMSGVLIGWQARQVETTTPKGRRAVWHGEKEGWIYPIKSEDGFSWSDNAVPKYYTCPGMKRYAALFGFDKALAQGKDFVVVVEGPIDCIKVGQKCVATLGSKITNQQIRLIRSNWNQIVWILDQDIDVESKWFKGVEADMSNEAGNNLYHMKMKTAKDPGELSKEEIWKEIHEVYTEDPNT